MQLSCLRAILSAGHFSRFACEKPAKLREINELSTYSNAQFCSEYSLLLCVCLCVAFCEIRVQCVQWQFFGDCMNSYPGSSLRSARNASEEQSWIKFAECTKCVRKDHEVVSEASSKLFQALKWIWFEVDFPCRRMQLSCFRAILSAGHFSRFACEKPVLKNEQQNWEN